MWCKRFISQIKSALLETFVAARGILVSLAGNSLPSGKSWRIPGEFISSVPVSRPKMCFNLVNHACINQVEIHP